jgi:REP element-mobilizing transposase RayT
MEQRAPPQGRQLRTGRVSLAHQVYHVTCVTQARARIFTQHNAAAVAARGFYHPSLIPHAATLAFVVMPDHIHWLLQLGQTATLSDAVRRYKARVSLLLGQRIWQRGFHDHALRREEDLASAARYIVANPLRAGLCGKIGDYPYWNAQWL